MPSVGRIGIDVFPDLDQFNRRLKVGLEAAEKRHKVEIPVRLATTNRQLASDIRNARDQGENIAKANNVKFRIPVGVKERDAETNAEIHSRVDEVNARLENGKTQFKVPIGVDRSALAADIKAAIREAKAELTAEDRTIQMVIDLDRTEFQRKFDELKHHYDGENIDLKADVDRGGKAAAQLAVLSRNRYVDLVVRVNQRSMATARATLAALTGANVLSSTGRALENLATNIDRYAGRFAVLGLLIANIASGSLASISAVTGLIADLGTLGGFALTLPTAIGAIAAGTVAGVMAFKNFGAAVTGTEEALNQLPLEAQKAAKALQGTWTSMQIPTQAAFWKEMGGAFEDLVDTVFPEVQVGLEKVGSASGKMLREVIRAFVDLGGKSVFTGMFDNLSIGLANASKGIRPFTGALIQLGSVGSQYLPKVGDWIHEISDTFADWVRRSAESGKINAWMENASKSAHNLGQAFKDAGGALSAIVGSIRVAGAGNLETLADTMNRIRRITESNVFQTGMANIFGGAHEAMALFKVALGDVGHALADLSPTLRTVMVTAGQIIADLMSGISRALTGQGFKTGLTEFFSGISTGVRGILQYLPRVSDGLGSLGEIVGKIASEFGPVVGQVFAEVSDIFKEMTPAIKDLIPVFADFVANSLNTMFTLLSPIADAIRTLIEGFNALPGPIQTAIIAFALLTRLLGGGVNVFRQFASSVLSIPASVKEAVAKANVSLSEFRLPQVIPPPAGGTAQQLLAHYRYAFNTATPQIQREYQRALANALKPGAMSLAGPTSEVARQLQAGLRAALAPGSMAWRGPTDAMTKGLDTALRQAVPAAYSRAEVTQVIRDGYGNMLSRSLASPGMWNGGVASAIQKSFGQGLSSALSGTRLSDSAFRTLQGNLATMTAGMFGNLNQLATVPMQNMGAAGAGAASQAMSRIGSAMQTGWAAVRSGVTSASSSIVNGVKGMFQLIGGAAGLGLIAVFTVMQDYSRQAREIEQINATMTQSFNAMAKAAFDAGQSIEGIASGKVAADTLAQFKDSVGGGVGFGLGLDVFGSKGTSFDDILAKGGFNRADVAKYMQGLGGAGMESFLKETRDKLDTAAGPAWSQNFLLDTNEARRNSAQLVTVFDQIIAAKQQADEELNLAWQVDPQGGAQAVLKNIKENISSTGKVTIDNIQGIQKGLDGMQTIGTGKVAQFAAAMSLSLGGTKEDFQKNFTGIRMSLLEFGQTAGEISSKDYMREIVKDLISAGVPVAKVKTALGDLGFTAEEAGNLIRFRFGPALNSIGQPITVLGEQIPKIRELGDGFEGVAAALSTASGVDSSRLLNALRLGGADPVATARGLAEAGVAFSDIQKVMEAMGVPAQTAAGALGIIRAELTQLGSPGIQQAKLAEFAKSLDAIRTSADGAAGRATALLAAIDALNNEINTSANIQVAFGSALESVRKLGGEGSEALLNLSKAVDTSQNKINFFAPGLETANSAFNNLAETGLSAVIQAMRDSAAAGGDMNAQQAAAAGVIDTQLRPTLDGLRADLEAQQAGTQITDQVWQQLLDTYHLTPEELITLATAQTAGATTDIQMLIQTIHGVPGQPVSGGPVVATFDSLTQGAVAKAQALGITVRQVADGRYELTLDADPTTARQQANGLVSYINGLSATVSININKYVQETATRIVREEKIAVADGGIFPTVGGRKPVKMFSNGGIVPSVAYYAHGGVENHRAQIAKAGAYRVWAEKETGGEAYIPLSPWKRNRSMQILRQVATMFGHQLVPHDQQVRRYSQGYAPQSSSPTTSTPAFNIEHWHQTGSMRPDEVAIELDRRWQMNRRR